MPISNNDKIMDMLAKTLQCYSNCVAIATVGTQFIIAANEFTRDTKQNDPQYLLVKNIMNYLKDIAINGIIYDHVRDDLMFKIHEARSRAKGLEIYGDVRKFIINNKAAVRKFITSARMKENKETVPSREECKSFPKEGNLHMKIAATYTDMRDIFKCISAIEDPILCARKANFYDPNKPEEDSYKITSEQLSAFQNFDDGYYSQNILFNESRKATGSVHAEMQILSDLISKGIKQSIYIGTSKRCCFNCDCMTTAANEVLGSYDLNLIVNTDVSHMGAFTETWVIPGEFSLSNKRKLFRDIETRYNEIYITKTPSSVYNMEHSEKSTPRSVANIAENYLASQIAVKEVLNKLLFSSDLTIQGNLEIVDYSIKLFNSEIFDSLFSIPINDENSLQRAAAGFYAGIIRSIEKEQLPKKGNVELLKKFLQTTAFFPDIEEKEKVIKILLSKFDDFREKIEYEEAIEYTDKAKVNPNFGLLFSTDLNSTTEILHSGLIGSYSYQSADTSNSEITQMNTPLAMLDQMENSEPKPKGKLVLK